MRVLVAVKRVVDANVVVRVKADHSAVELANIKMAINPFCEIAVEAGVRLREQGVATELVVVSVGDDSCQEQLRTALAMGADRAVLIKTPADLEPLNIAKLLMTVSRRENADLVLLGKQSIDGDNHQTGQMLAGLMGCGQATCASQIRTSADGIEVVREVDGGMETWCLRLPAVITADLRLNEPRYATLPSIMKARKKPLEILAADELGINLAPRLEVLKVSEPPARQGGVRVASVAELVDQLQRQAGVL